VKPLVVIGDQGGIAWPVTVTHRSGSSRRRRPGRSGEDVGCALRAEGDEQPLGLGERGGGVVLGDQPGGRRRPPSVGGAHLGGGDQRHTQLHRPPVGHRQRRCQPAATGGPHRTGQHVIEQRGHHPSVHQAGRPLVGLPHRDPAGGAPVGGVGGHQGWCHRVARPVDRAVPALADLGIVDGRDVVQAAGLRAEAGGEPAGRLGRAGQLIERNLGADGGVDQVPQRSAELADRLATGRPLLRGQRPSGAPVRVHRHSCRGPPRACEWWGAGGSFLMPASRSSAPPMITRCTSLVPS
jgi:hypothetical protein